MESNPTVFKLASEITIIAKCRDTIQLTAPGFVCEVHEGYSGIGVMLRSVDENQVREGFDSPLAYVVSGQVGTSAVCHFTSRAEADRLIANIVETRTTKDKAHKIKPEPYQKPWTGVLKTVVEVCAIALTLGFLGSGAANIGWNLASPLGARIADATRTTVLDPTLQSGELKHMRAILAVLPNAVLAAKNEAQLDNIDRNIQESKALQDVAGANEQELNQAYETEKEVQRQQINRMVNDGASKSPDPAGAYEVVQALKPSERAPANEDKTDEDAGTDTKQALRDQIRQHIPPFAILPEHENTVDAKPVMEQN